jgi:hypothetical protein
VYVVASVSGGAGSGMSLDVGYAVRAALDKMGAADAEIIGIFLHATGRDPRHCDLARVNSYAWLTEYNHFHRPGAAYPGDECCGLPAMTAGRKAFDAAYLVDLGLESEDGEPSDAAQAVAEYIYLDALTPAQDFLSLCRRETDANGSVAALRTFSLHKIPAASNDVISRAASTLSREVVLSWTGSDSAAGEAAQAPSESLRDTNQIVQGAATLVGQLQLKLEGLASNARALIEAQFGGDQQAFLANLLATVSLEGKRMTPLEAVRAIDRLFAPPHEDDKGAFVMQRPLDAIVSPLSMKLAGDLARWVLRKLDDRQDRLVGAERAAQWLVDHLKAVDSDANRMAEGLTRQASATVEELRRDPRAETASPEAAFARTMSYFRSRIDLQAVRASSHIARKLLAELKSVAATIAEFGRHLKHMAVNLPSAGGPEDAPADPLTKALVEELPTLIQGIDARLQESFIDEQGGLFTTIMGNSRVRAQMLTVLGKLARQAAEGLATRATVINSAFDALGDASSGEPDAPSATSSVMPQFLEHGGAYRKLAIVPAEAGGRPLESWRHSVGEDATLVAAPGNDVVTVCEGWRLPLVHVALDLIQRRRDYADFAARVQTRCDVAWTPLTSPMAAIAPPTEAFESLPDDVLRTTQVLS